MFKLASNTEIGKYINKLIKENPKFRSNRDFGKACLEEDDMPLSESAINTKSGHISEITRGITAVQIKDLPAFTKLLDVSCEDILSAGKSRTANGNHLTNYQIAASSDEKLWKEIKKDSEHFLNPDEYDKTIIDYALEFENYDFLKYLMNNEYIWFVSKEPKKDYCSGFGADTSVKRRPFGSSKILESRLTEDDSLRRKLIALAIKNDDIEMLYKLKAREIPPMYNLNVTYNHHIDYQKYCDTEMINAVSQANKNILDYFSEEITIKPVYGKFTFQCMFPFIGLLLDKMIKDKNPYAEIILKRCIEHNKAIYETIKEYTGRVYGSGKGIYSACYLGFQKSGNIISVYDLNQGDGTATNIIHVNENSNNAGISKLICELNKYYDEILVIKSEKGEK